MPRLFLLCALHATDPALYKPHVTLVEQKGDIVPGSTPPRIRAQLTFRNDTRMPVDSIRLGVVFAASQADFAGLNPDLIYEPGATAPPSLRVVQQELPLQLPPDALVTSTVTLEVTGPAFKPVAFLTHVLSYSLTDLDADALAQLIDSTASADQVAACNAFALTGDAAAKQMARQRWRDKPVSAQVFAGFAAQLAAPPPATPQMQDTFRRVYAVRALGVLGGPQAQATLSALAQDEKLAAFDAPLQVLRQARATSTVRHTPLAFAIPGETQHFAQVVEAALAEVEPQPVIAARTGVVLMITTVVLAAATVALWSRRRG